MTTRTAAAPTRIWRSALAAATTVALAIGGAVIAAPASQAAEGDISAATLDWGVKESFRNYVGGGIAHGGWETGGAITPSSTFSWSGGSGSYSTTAGSGQASYGGSIHFTGHDGALDLTISDVRIAVQNADSAQIIADVVSKPLGGSDFATYADIAFATISLSGAANHSDGVISWVSAPSVLTAEGAAAFAGFYAAGTALDPVSFSWPIEAAPEPEPETPVSPVVTVAEAPAAGGTVTVTGSGFNPVGVGIYIGIAPSGGSGFYGVTPSDTVWVAAGNADGSSGMGRTAPLGADGTFSTTLTAPAAGEYSIYTSKAHGQGISDVSQNTITPLSYAAPIPVAPSVTVSKTDGLATGDVVTVTGTGFGAAEHPSVVGTRPPLAGTFTGAYVVFGSFPEVWKPSEGAPLTVRKTSDTKWVVNPADVATIGGADAGAVAINPDGSFELELTVTEGFEGAPADGNYGIYTYAGGGVKYAPFETFTPIAFAAPVVVPEVPLTPPTAPAAVVPGGSLSWGVKESFRSYITGPIAHGSITSSGVSTSGGAFVFGQTTGGSYTLESGVGTSNYSGSVRFTGHGGILDTTIANPTITVGSANAASLTVTSNGVRVVIANLNLAAAGRSVTDGAVSYRGVPATLTASGASVFANGGSAFYPAGTALDLVSFTVGAPSATGSGTVTVASYTPSVRTPAATPPATTGASLAAGGAPVVEGGEVTFSATGFQPNESGILVVIYSEPVVLDTNATADAAGTVTWTGRLPEGLSGTHTLTLQGSVDRGLVLEIPSSLMAASASVCPVSDAEIVWGFKEAFRSYISGSIAHGEWSVDGGAEYETPNFSWGDGEGGYDPESAEGEIAFTGTVTFTGHDGVLNTSIANPRIEFVDEESAFILLDISGTTQGGEVVDQPAVRFVELDLGAAEVSTEGGVVTIGAAPAALTAEGAAAFGTYEVGTEFDPVDLSFGTDDGCSAAPVVTASDDADDVATSDDGGAGWLLWLVIGLVVLAVAIVVTILIIRRNSAKGTGDAS